MGDEAALLKNKVSICKGYHEVIETRLKETDDLLAPGDVDPVKVTRSKISISEKHFVLKKLDEEIIDLVKDDAELVREITESNKSIYEEWTSFWDMYNVSVHTNSSLSPIQKCTYSLTLLSQAASAAVAGLTLSEANYDEAIKILRDRFGNQEKIIVKHMEELLYLDSSIII
uniref:Uncharacterized protein n=1 Tax=Amphimedon queenslandica TaxID=400682 RepID=A0A1X7UB26_AMPQE